MNLHCLHGFPEWVDYPVKLCAATVTNVLMYSVSPMTPADLAVKRA